MKGITADERIKEKSKQLFFSHGLRSVSMDDVARACGMSKKSVYQYFKDKNALVCAIVRELIQTHKRLLKICNVAAKDAIDEVITQNAQPFEIWTAICPAFFYELEKSFPEAWHKLKLYKFKMFDDIVSNLEWGKREGLYRNNIQVAFIGEVWLHQLISFLLRRFTTTKKWSIQQSLMELTSLHLHSITTEKGKKVLYRYLPK